MRMRGIHHGRNRRSGQDIKTRHGLGECLHAKQRTGRRSGGDCFHAAASSALGGCACYEWIQTSNGSQQSAARDKPPLYELTTGNLAVGIGFDDLSPVFARVCRIFKPPLRRFFRQKKHFFAITLASHSLRSLVVIGEASSGRGKAIQLWTTEYLLL